MQLGFAHPDHLLAVLDSKQVTEWLAFYRFRPFGFVREAQLFGTLAAQQHNLHRTGSGRAKQPFDFFPIILKDEEAAQRGSEELIRKFQKYNVERGFHPLGRK